MVDVSSFASRAERWSDAQTRHRDDAIERAEALAALQRRMESEESEAEEEAEAAEPEVPAPSPPAAPAPTAPTAPAPTAPAPTAPAPTAPAPAPTAPAPAPTAPAPTDPDFCKNADVEDVAATFGLLPPADGPSLRQWCAMRHCESRHQYDVVSPSGAYRGAWQFSYRTWDWVAEERGYDHLVEVDPKVASPAEQDLMAYELYDIGGAGHWPVCGKRLR